MLTPDQDCQHRRKEALLGQWRRLRFLRQSFASGLGAGVVGLNVRVPMRKTANSAEPTDAKSEARYLWRVVSVLRWFLTLSSLLACLVLVALLRLGRAHFMEAGPKPIATTARHAIADQAAAPGIQNRGPVILAENPKGTPTPTSSPILRTFTPTLTSTLTLTFTPVATYYLPVVVCGRSLPDLTITNMHISLRTGHSCSYTSTQLGVWVSFQNIGNADAGPFVVEANGARRTVTSGLVTRQGGSLWFREFVYMGENVAFVDATFQVTESSENNNQLSQWLPVPTLPPTCTPTTTP
jgi:hypothetical protein